MAITVSEQLCTDVLVVGGGAAALMAAIAAARSGVKVLVVDKGQVGKSGCSPNAHGGMAVYYKDPRDSWRVHMEDTLMSGGFLNDQELVQTLCANGYKFLAVLEQFGCIFDRDADGSYAVRKFGGHRYARSAFAGDETGHEMMNGLKRELLRLDVPVLEEHMVLRLLTHPERGVVGAVALDIAGGNLVEIRAKATVLATADAAGIWPAASERQRGDGFIMAVKAGAELVDMEFVQYHPTHAWWPYGVRGSVSESFRSEGGRLLNASGERFMQYYDPEKMELATRDKVSVAIFKEILAGRGAPHGGIYASVAHLPPDYIERRLRVIFRKYLSYGIDIRKDPIEVRPRPHYHCGGVKIDARGATKVPGLYAAGAVTGGVHGANRLGSNALVDILVFGEIAGASAAEHAVGFQGQVPSASGQAREVEKQIADLMERNPSHPVYAAEIRRRHVEMMDRYMGVLRTEEGIERMLEEIQRTREQELPRLRVRDQSRRFNLELVDALEVFLRLDVEEMATRAALERRESRGTHYRDDYPERNDREWLKNIVWTWRNGEYCREIRPVAMPYVKLEDVPEYAHSTSPWH